MGAASVQACGGMTIDSSHTRDGQGGDPPGGGPASAGAKAVALSSSSTGGNGNATSGPFSNGGATSTPTPSSGGSFGNVEAGSAGVAGIGGSLPFDAGSPSMCAHPQQFRCSIWDP